MLGKYTASLSERISRYKRYYKISNVSKGVNMQLLTASNIGPEDEFSAGNYNCLDHNIYTGSRNALVHYMSGKLRTSIYRRINHDVVFVVMDHITADGINPLLKEPK